MTGFPTPEAAVLGGDSVPPRYVRVIEVSYSPEGSRAVVFLEYNEPPSVEPYVVMCEKTAGGWIEGNGASGGGLSWMSTHEEPDGRRLGVFTAWAPPTARWNVQVPDVLSDDEEDFRSVNEW